jgi:hypothetical protein
MFPQIKYNAIKDVSFLVSKNICFVESYGLFAIHHTDLHGNTSQQNFTFYGSYELVTDCGFHKRWDFCDRVDSYLRLKDKPGV